MQKYFYSSLYFNLSTSIHSSQINSFSDKLIMVNNKDEQIGSITKLKAHLKSEKNLYPHRAFSIFLFNINNELLLQQRASVKVTFPLLWSNTVCSHPLDIPNERETRNNEGIFNAAVRRMKFELGLNTKKNKYLLFNKILYKADSDTKFEEFEIDYLLLIKDFGMDSRLDYVKKVFNREEIKNVKFMKINEVISDIKKKPKKYSPWFKFIISKKGREILEVMKKDYLKYKYDGNIINFI